MNKIIKEQSCFFEYVNNSIIKNNKISHAYLIETNGYIEYKEVVLELIKTILSLNKTEKEKEKISNQVNNQIYPDLKFIYPDGNFIKKEQLLSLEFDYSKNSMLDNKLIYVISPADKLNLSSANAILKFLEEPPDDIIAILVTENKYNVLETIVSRCQCLSLINYGSCNYREELIEFISELQTPKKILIKYDYYLEKIFFDRNSSLESLKFMEDFLFTRLKENNNKEYNFVINQIQLIESEKEILQYNINVKLWFSNYIFKIMEVNNNV